MAAKPAASFLFWLLGLITLILTEDEELFEVDLESEKLSDWNGEKVLLKEVADSDIVKDLVIKSAFFLEKLPANCLFMETKLGLFFGVLALDEGVEFKWLSLIGANAILFVVKDILRCLRLANSDQLGC